MLNAALFRDHRSQLAKLVLLMCGLYFALAFTGQAWKARGLGERLAAERATLAEQQAANARLQARVDFLNGPGYEEYVERTAREQLGMAKPGDVSLFIVPDSNAPKVEPSVPLPEQVKKAAPPAPAQPVWRQWVAIFFP